MQPKKGYYKHFKKGDMVKVVGIAKHSETLEDLVVYDHLGNNALSDLWVRPVAMFLEEVEVDGKMVKRFEYVGEELPR